MPDYESTKPKQPVDYRGLLAGLLGAPVFFLFTLLYDADAGLAATLAFTMALLAIMIRWKLRKHIWFWAIIAVVLALHVPLVFIVQWPHGHGPTLLYTIPVGIADFLIINGALGLGEKLFTKGDSLDEDR